LPHLVGLLARLLQKVRLAELDQHALGAGRDQRRARLDEKRVGPHPRRGQLRDFHFSAAKVLEDLPHHHFPVVL